MNTISSIKGAAAMDSQNYFNNVSSAKQATVQSQKIEQIMPTGPEVAQNIVQNIAEVKQDAQQIQKLSDIVMGRELQFNVNQELGSIVVKIVDPSTQKVIKEIPSREMQDLKVSIRKAIGLLFDELT